MSESNSSELNKNEAFKKVSDDGEDSSNDPESEKHTNELKDPSDPIVGKKSFNAERERVGTQRTFLSNTLIIVLGAVVVCGCIGWWRGHDMTTYVMFTEPFFTLIAVMIGFYFKESS